MDRPPSTCFLTWRRTLVVGVILMGAQVFLPATVEARQFIAVTAGNLDGGSIRLPFLPDHSVVLAERLAVEGRNRSADPSNVLLWDLDEDATAIARVTCIEAGSGRQFEDFLQIYIDRVMIALPGSVVFVPYLESRELLPEVLAEDGVSALLDSGEADVPAGMLSPVCEGQSAVIAVPTDTATPSPTATPSLTPISISPTPTPSPTGPTSTPTVTPDQVRTSTPSTTPTQDQILTATPTQDQIVTATPTASPTPTATACAPEEMLVCDLVAESVAAVGCSCVDLFGDASCDGRVSAADPLSVALLVGSGQRATCERDDLNDDGVVDSVDLSLCVAAIFHDRPPTEAP